MESSVCLALSLTGIAFLIFGLALIAGTKKEVSDLEGFPEQKEENQWQ